MFSAVATLNLLGS